MSRGGTMSWLTRCRAARFVNVWGRFFFGVFFFVFFFPPGLAFLPSYSQALGEGVTCRQEGV